METNSELENLFIQPFVLQHISYIKDILDKETFAKTKYLSLAQMPP